MGLSNEPPVDLGIIRNLKRSIDERRRIKEHVAEQGWDYSEPNEVGGAVIQDVYGPEEE